MYSCLSLVHGLYIHPHTGKEAAYQPERGKEADDSAMDTAKYTVNEVEDRTQVPAGTLRQWERRYGVPRPERAQSGYRLYSDTDIDHIVTMKRFIADGIPASRAAELVQRRPSVDSGRSSAELKAILVRALVDFDEAQADQVLSEAHSLHPVETVLLEVMRAGMVEIGQRWHDGEITISTEHFASNYLLGRLRNLLSLSAHNRGRLAPTVLVACAPLEQHETGALMLAVLLRRAGFRIVYLGANTPIDDLRATAADLRPDIVAISATTEEAIAQLSARRSEFAAMAPLLTFGGPAFNREPERATHLGGHFLSDDIATAVEQLESLLDGVGRQ